MKDLSTGRDSATSHSALWPRASAAATLLVAALFVTGAAAIWQPTMWVGSEHEQVDGDLVIPVIYETVAGASVDCTYVAFLNTPAGRNDLDRALAHLSAQDWSTFGEDVKRYALEHPVTDSDAGWEHADQELREQAAFSMAAATVVRQRAGELLPDDTTVAATTNCEGVLS